MRSGKRNGKKSNMSRTQWLVSRTRKSEVPHLKHWEVKEVYHCELTDESDTGAKLKCYRNKIKCYSNFIPNTSLLYKTTTKMEINNNVQNEQANTTGSILTSGKEDNIVLNITDITSKTKWPNMLKTIGKAHEYRKKKTGPIQIQWSQAGVNWWLIWRWVVQIIEKKTSYNTKCVEANDGDITRWLWCKFF